MDVTQRTKRTQAQRRADARRRLLDAAVELIAEGGTSAVTLPAVGARAGCSRGVPSYHFGTKADLVEAAVEQIEHQFWMTVGPTHAEGASADTVVRLATMVTAEIRQGSPALRAQTVLWATAITDPQIAARIAPTSVRLRQLVAEVVERGQAAGDIDQSVRAPGFAALFVACIRGLAIERLLTPNDPGVADLESELEVFVRHRLERDG